MFLFAEALRNRQAWVRSCTILPVPSTVRIFHRRAGHVHIFTSPELRGLHVGHSDLEQAFALIPEAVSGLVELETGIDAIYEPEAPFEQFRLKVSDDGELDLASPVLPMKVGTVPPSCSGYVAA